MADAREAEICEAFSNAKVTVSGGTVTVAVTVVVVVSTSPQLAEVLATGISLTIQRGQTFMIRLTNCHLEDGELGQMQRRGRRPHSRRSKGVWSTSSWRSIR